MSSLASGYVQLEGLMIRESDLVFSKSQLCSRCTRYVKQRAKLAQLKIHSPGYLNTHPFKSRFMLWFFFAE
jgi:hypothetical protein